MNRPTYRIIFLLIVCLLSSKVQAFESPDDILIVANSEIGNVQVELAELREIFLKKRSTLGAGKSVLAIHALDGSKIRAEFRYVVLEMNSNQEKKYWEDMKIKSAVVPPVAESEPWAVLNSHAGAIAYVYRSHLQLNRVKVLLTIPAYLPLSAEDQAKLFVKTINFDQTMIERSQGGLRLGIVSLAQNASSVKAGNKFLRLFSKQNVQNRILEAVEINIQNDSDLEKMVSGKQVDILFLCPGAESLTKEILAQASRNKILVGTGDPELVAQGAAVGVARNFGKPAILLNLKAVKSQGGKFDPRLIRLAKIIQ